LNPFRSSTPKRIGSAIGVDLGFKILYISIHPPISALLFQQEKEERYMEKKEKPLEKLTAKELREMALGLPGIHGVHAMKKEELLVAIRKAKGLPEPEKEKKVAVKKEKVILTAAQMKQKMRELKAKRAEILQQRNFKMAQILKKRINRLKKMTRRVG